MGNVKAERLVFVLIDELQRVFVDQMRGVALFFGFLFAVPPVVLIVVSPVVDIIDITAVVASEIIKAMVFRMILGSFLRVS